MGRGVSILFDHPILVVFIAMCTAVSGPVFHDFLPSRYRHDVDVMTEEMLGDADQMDVVARLDISQDRNIAGGALPCRLQYAIWRCFSVVDDQHRDRTVITVTPHDGNTSGLSSLMALPARSIPSYAGSKILRLIKAIRTVPNYYQ